LQRPSQNAALGAAAALFFVFLWASAYVPSKTGVLNSSPLWFLVVRFAVSGGIFLAVAMAMGGKLPRAGRDWIAIVVLGITSNAIYLGCTYEALRHMAAGIGAIVASTNPLVLAFAAPFLLRERLTRLKVAGLLMGFGGVVAIMIVRTGTGSAQPLDMLLAFVGVLGSVAGTIVFKKYCGDFDLKIVTALQLLVAGVTLFPLALIFEGAPHAIWGAPIVESFVYVVLVMSIGASTLWFWLLTHGEASRVSAYYFLTPIFGLFLAAILLHEPVTVRDLFGLAGIAVGIALVQRG
jgi:drug/metabolite transporter (DMT)-like permease